MNQVPTIKGPVYSAVAVFPSFSTDDKPTVTVQATSPEDFIEIQLDVAGAILLFAALRDVLAPVAQLLKLTGGMPGEKGGRTA